MWTEIQIAKREGRHELKLNGEEINKKLELEKEDTLPSELFHLAGLNFLEISQLHHVTSFPNDVERLENLTQLSVHHNSSLSTIGAGIGKLQKLKFLDLSFNCLSCLPPDVFESTGMLSSLNLSGNSLSKLPSMNNLSSLHHLNLSINKFEVFPVEIYKITSLMELDISNNIISEIPDGIGQLSMLKSFISVHNQLLYISADIVLCTKLKSLNLHENELIKDNQLRKMTQAEGPTNVSSVFKYLKKQSKSTSKNLSSSTRPEFGCSNNTDPQRVIIKIEPSDKFTKVANTTFALIPAVDIRPYMCLFVVKNIVWSSLFELKDFVKFQEELHSSICDYRLLCTIGTHDFDTVQFPLLYTKMLREEIEMRAIGRSKKEGVLDLLKRLQNEADKIRKLKKRQQLLRRHWYLNTLQNEKSYPVLLDANKTVISLPPVTNCDETCLTQESRNILVEVTGKNLTMCRQVCDRMVEWFASRRKNMASNEAEDIEVNIKAVSVFNASDGGLSSVYPSRADLKNSELIPVFLPREVESE